MKRILTLCALTLLALGLGSCHKTCTCTTYNNVQHTYTAEEVEAAGVSCYDMRFLDDNYQYYAVCSWD